LIDGPNEKRFFASDAEIARYFRSEDGNPFGHRDDPSGLAAIKSVTLDCVYHPHPSSTNGLCICLRRSAPLIGRLPAILDFLGVQLERKYRPADTRSVFRRFV
jgi:hypothetical protein